MEIGDQGPRLTPLQCLRLALVWAMLVALLALPVLLTLEHLQDSAPAYQALAGAIGIGLLLFAALGRVRSAIGVTVVAMAGVTLLLLRGTHFGLVDFAGAGFTPEVFLHAEWQSVVLAWQEHDRTLRRVLLLLLVFSGLLWWALQHRVWLSTRLAGILLLVACALMFSAGPAMPTLDLWRAWQEWNAPLSSELDPDTLARFDAIGLLEVDVLSKRAIEARPSAEAKNLILVYVESLGRNLADQSQWPGLMPNYSRMLDEHGWIDSIWASSYITIEGLTNSMCGTLFPFDRGNETMAAGAGLAEGLPCLGDVLDRAGYQQVYLGGARMNFAGKGEFLASHGYLEQRGLGYWRDQGLRQRSGTWGLSDADLFQQATLEIGRLREGAEPFNLTLLTIGTHLPGYFYAECDRYPNSDHDFLQALHCTDQLLGRWVEELDSLGYLDNTLLVITADHHVFPNPAMQELFGDDVYDRRLPLIVIGETDTEPAVEQGAGYDLAPTVLDLLEVEHDARFILGRSLARENARPDYYLTRYADVFNAQRTMNVDGQCGSDPAGDIDLPLNRCEKQSLLSTLEAMVLSVSAPPLVIDCQIQLSTVLQLPASPEQRVRLMKGDLEAAQRFTHRARTVDGREPGLYTLSFDAEFRLVKLGFFPAQDLPAVERLRDEIFIGAEHVLLAWKPTVGSADLPIDSDLKDLLALGPFSGWAMISEQDKMTPISRPTEISMEPLAIDLSDLLCAGRQ